MRFPSVARVDQNFIVCAYCGCNFQDLDERRDNEFDHLLEPEYRIGNAINAIGNSIATFRWISTFVANMLNAVFAFLARKHQRIHAVETANMNSQMFWHICNRTALTNTVAVVISRLVRMVS